MAEIPSDLSAAKYPEIDSGLKKRKKKKKKKRKQSSRAKPSFVVAQPQATVSDEKEGRIEEALDRSPELKAKEDASEQVADEVIATAIANNEPKKKKKKKRVRKTRKVQPSVVPNITTADEAAEILEPSLRNFSTIHEIDSIQSDTDKGSREDAGVPVAGEIPMTSSTVKLLEH